MNKINNNFLKNKNNKKNNLMAKYFINNKLQKILLICSMHKFKKKIYFN